MEIYQPAEDSHLFSNFLKKFLKNKKGQTLLDMGTGSGILAETASKFLDKKNILTADINPATIKLLKSKGFKSIKSNLFSKIKNKFDIILFNAPYLPKDKKEPTTSRKATTGGERGDEISLKFLRQAKEHINKDGKIFLLISSLTPVDKIKKFRPKIVVRKKIQLLFPTSRTGGNSFPQVRPVENVCMIYLKQILLLNHW